jgi:hypothetical protein
MPYLTSAHAWSFGATLAMTMVLFTAISKLHVFAPTGTIAPNWMKQAGGLVAVVVIILVPLAWKNLNTLDFLAIMAAVTTALVVFEMFALMKKGKKRVERSMSA